MLLSVVSPFDDLPHAAMSRKEDKYRNTVQGPVEWSGGSGTLLNVCLAPTRYVKKSRNISNKPFHLEPGYVYIYFPARWSGILSTRDATSRLKSSPRGWTLMLSQKVWGLEDVDVQGLVC